jgi:hypothetical protein
MTRDELEHLIRASADVTDQYEFIIVGSQSILGPVPNPPAVFTMSAEADIYPLQAPELADKIDGAIGEGSRFHQTFGYYAQGVGPETAVLPQGWFDRLHRVQSAATRQRVGYCLDLPDLFMSKAAAGREKDRDFCMAMLIHRYVKPTQVLALVAAMPLDDAARRRLRSTLVRWIKTLQAQGHDLPPG